MLTFEFNRWHDISENMYMYIAPLGTRGGINLSVCDNNQR